MTSFDETFNESFGEENILPTLTRSEVIIEEEKIHTENENNIIPHNLEEDNINLQNPQEPINKGVKEGTEQVISMLNKDISESNDKLDEIIKKTKKKTSKPLPMGKTPTDQPIYSLES